MGAEREGVPFIVWFVDFAVGYDYGTHGEQKPGEEIASLFLPDGSKFVQENANSALQTLLSANCEATKKLRELIESIQDCEDEGGEIHGKTVRDFLSEAIAILQAKS